MFCIFFYYLFIEYDFVCRSLYDAQLNYEFLSVKCLDIFDLLPPPFPFQERVNVPAEIYRRLSSGQERSRDEIDIISRVHAVEGASICRIQWTPFWFRFIPRGSE